MAEISVKFFSEALNRNVRFEVYLPNDRPLGESRRMRTLFWLHGYTGDAENLVPEWMAKKYNIAVVSPNGENGFWLDGLSTGRKYCTFVGEELVGYIRRTFGLAVDADRTYIMGISMGGFGALHTALTYPENFGKVGAMSSALIVHEIAHMKPQGGNEVANYDYYHECFGDLETVEESNNNPEVLIKQIKENDRAVPQIFMCCGTEDFLIENNREFHRYLDRVGVQHSYFESSGTHDMKFWNEYTVKLVDLMFGEG